MAGMPSGISSPILARTRRLLRKLALPLASWSGNRMNEAPKRVVVQFAWNVLESGKNQEAIPRTG